MTIISKTAFAALVVIGGIAGATQAQAGTSSVMLSQGGFEDRCLDNGGEYLRATNGGLCALETTDIACAFESVYSYCEWEGGQNKREVIAVIGQPVAESLSETGIGRPKLKLIFVPVFPIFP